MQLDEGLLGIHLHSQASETMDKQSRRSDLSVGASCLSPEHNGRVDIVPVRVSQSMFVRRENLRTRRLV